jgi:hypothetical protein
MYKFKRPYHIIDGTAIFSEGASKRFPHTSTFSEASINSPRDVWLWRIPSLPPLILEIARNFASVHV